MAYLKQSWNTGDTITAKKLNHIEKGIEDNTLNRVHVEYDSSLGSYYLDKTYSEIDRYAYNQGFIPVFAYASTDKTVESFVGFVTFHNYSNDIFMVTIATFDQTGAISATTFTTEIEDGQLVAIPDNG